MKDKKLWYFLFRWLLRRPGIGKPTRNASPSLSSSPPLLLLLLLSLRRNWNSYRPTNHSLWPSSVADEDGMLLHFSENRLPVRKTRLVSSRHGSHIMHIKASGDVRRPTNDVVFAVHRHQRLHQPALAPESLRAETEQRTERLDECRKTKLDPSALMAA